MSRAAGVPSRDAGPLRTLARGAAFLVHRYVLGTEFLRARGRGLDLRVRAHDVIGRHIYKYGVHDPSLTAFFESRVRLEAGDVVLDVGANVGWFSLLLASLAPSEVDVFAFEPHPGNRALLEANVAANAPHGVTVVAAAVSDRLGETVLFLYEGENSGRHSLLPLHEGPSVAARTVTLDGFWADAGLGARIPRLVKIDIEGHEPAAVRGGRGVLERCPTVVLEFSPALLRSGGLAPAETLDFMAGLGFDSHLVADGRLHSVTRDRLLGDDRQVNVVWTRGGTA